MGRASSLRWPLVASLALLGACRAAPAREDTADPVILALDEEAVRRSDFERYLRRVETQGDGQVGPALREALLEPFLEERVLILAARQRGLLRGEGGPQAEAEAVRTLLAEAALSRAGVTEAEAAAYYQAHPAEFGTPERVVLRQIVVPTENEGRDVRRRLQKDARSFEVLARSRSHAPEASAGGLMGAFARGELPPELEAAAFGLAPGALSEVVSSPMGYHVLRVDSRQAARAPSFAECRPQVQAALSRQRSEQAVHQFVQSLLSRAKVNHEAAKAALPHPS